MRRALALAGLLALAVAGSVVSIPAVAGQSLADRQVLYAHESTYPRVIRLEHSGGANGRILTSLGAWSGNNGMGVIHESDDGGQTFHQIATIPDPDAANGLGMCCSTLYELPSQVGTMPAGTLLWADSVGYNAPAGQRHTRQRLWTSSDHGYHWSYLSDITVAPNPYNTWEPELSVAADGSLVVFFSDETDKTHHDQKLVQMRSTDGKTWGDYKETVISSNWYVRPGMASVRRLPNGTYFLAYEVCNNDPKHLCSIYFRTSKDGWNYGDPSNLGTLVRTADGKYARHTPTLAWSPGPGPNGTILMISEILVNADGSYAPGNGKTILANDNLGAGPWYEIPAPVAVAGVVNAGCKNFSPAILASTDGTSVLEVTNDKDGNVCKAYYGTAPLSHP